jgi:hypothetical protein
MYHTYRFIDADGNIFDIIYAESANWAASDFCRKHGLTYKFNGVSFFFYTADYKQVRYTIQEIL